MRTFVEPNFRCRVSPDDAPNRLMSRVIYAASEQEARKLLESRGYIVRWIRPYKFDLWKKAAARAKANAKRHHGPGYKFLDLWSSLKEHLQYLNDQKCAYCDGSYVAFCYGDVEHFRPKAAVTEDPTHPGYWWLAYEPSNYLPSCQLCNQDAKQNHFPIAGTRASKEGDLLGLEKPLLLHAGSKNWFAHIRFNPCTDMGDPGLAVGLTPEGQESIKDYRLNRARLRDARIEAQQAAADEYRMAFSGWVLLKVKDYLNSLLKKYESGELPFYAAAMDEINATAAELGVKQPFEKNA
jgi:hypothetical protein